MLKVTKFGGSSMADAGQYRKVRDIILSDPERRVVVVSAAGKRNKNDHKITDLLYLCYAHVQYGVNCDSVFDMIRSRYLEIRDELGVKLDLEREFAALKQRLEEKSISQDALHSLHQILVPLEVVVNSLPQTGHWYRILWMFCALNTESIAILLSL